MSKEKYHSLLKDFHGTDQNDLVTITEQTNVTDPIQLFPSDSIINDVTNATPKIRKQRKCTSCGAIGHDKRNCPEYKDSNGTCK